METDSIFSSVELQEVSEREIATLENHLAESVIPGSHQLTLTKSNFEKGENGRENSGAESDDVDSSKDISTHEDSGEEFDKDKERSVTSTQEIDKLESCVGMPSASSTIGKVRRKANENAEFDFDSGQTSSVKMKGSKRGKKSDSSTSPGFCCSWCELSFSSQEYCERHQYEVHNEEYCKLESRSDDSDEESADAKQCESIHSQKEEAVSSGRPKIHACKVCGKKFSSNDHLRHHFRVHTGEKPYKCTICHKAFAQGGNLHAHMRIHTNERPFKCNVCDKTFNQSGNLHSHMTTHMDSKDKKKFQCPTCCKYFTQSGSLRNHVKIHTGEKPHKCSVCDKAFLRKNHLDAHSRTHTGERPFICSLCGRGFTQTGDLQSHMRLHTGDFPYPCKVCGKGFTASGHLNKHMRIHTGEKPYVCSLCKRAFNASSTLVTHMRMHTGERPYVCSICDRGFYGSSNLRKHMRVHTGENLLARSKAITNDSPKPQS